MRALNIALPGSVVTRFQPCPLPCPAALSPLLHSSDFTFEVEGFPVRGRLTAPPGDGQYPLTTLRWRLGDVMADLILPDWLTARLLRTAEPEPSGDIDGMTATLLLEMALAEPLSRLEAACGEPLELIDDKHPTTALPPAIGNDIVLGVTGLFDGEPFVGTLRAPMQAMGALQRLAIASTVSNALIEPPIALAVRFGLARLDATLLRSLDIGDAIVPEQLPEAAVVIVAGERLTAPGRLDGSRVILEARPRQAAETATETWLMTEHPGPNVPDPKSLALQDTALQDLQVTLVFELARQAATLRDVRSLAPGHVIELGPLAERHVSVLANGSRIGEGEIVRVGDVTAVRLTRFTAG